MRRKILLLVALVFPLARPGVAGDEPRLNVEAVPAAENRPAGALSTPGFPDHSSPAVEDLGQTGRNPAPDPLVGQGLRSPAGTGPIASGGFSQGSQAAGSLANLMTAGDMIGFSRDLGDGVQAITIINASKRWMAVYHIDSGGQIRLTSSRPLDADFTIQFNASSPLPEEIRRLQGK